MEIRDYRTAEGAARALGAHLLDLFFPPACLLCTRVLLAPREREQSTYSAVLCSDCAPEAPLAPELTAHGDQCRICGETGATYGIRDGRCLPCILVPLGVENITSVWNYDGRAEALVKTFKYGRCRGLAEYLSLSLKERLRSAFLGTALIDQGFLSDCGLVLGVPSPAGSLRSRGFNHLGMLVRRLGRELNVTSDVLALRSRRNRPPQAGVRLNERRDNASGAFVAQKHRVAGKKIILVDDVLTTGSSIASCAKALRKADAATIVAVTLARSPRFQTNRLKAFFNAKGR